MGNGNEENLTLIRQAMANANKGALADEVASGGQAQHTEYIDYTSTEGVRYQGNVVFKRPTMKDTMLIGGIKAKYFSDAGILDLDLVDNSVRVLAHVMAHLQVIVVKSPPWLLDVDSVTDSEILYEVFSKFRKWDDSFRRAVPEVQERDSETSEDPEAMDA